MKQALFFLLLCSICISCKKHKDEPKSNPDEQLSYTNTYNINGHTIKNTYSYNSRGMLYEEFIKDETTGEELYQTYRHKDNMLYLSDIANDRRKVSKIKYTFLHQKLSSMEYFEYDQYENTTFLFKRSFEYANEHFKISNTGAGGAPGEYQIFAFSGGNVIEVSTYSASGAPVNTITYEYDGKTNPYQGKYDQLHSPEGYSKSNITKSTFTDHQNGDQVSVTAYAYEYNSAGHPTKLYSAGANRKLLKTYYYQ